MKKKYFEIQIQDNMLKCMLFSNRCYQYQTQIMKVSLFQKFFSLIDDESSLFEKAKMHHDFCKYGDYIIYKYVKIKKDCDLNELIEVVVDLIKLSIANVHKRQCVIDQFLDNPTISPVEQLNWERSIY